MANTVAEDQRIADILSLLRGAHASMKAQGLVGGGPGEGNRNANVRAEAYREAVRSEFPEIEFEVRIDRESKSTCDILDPVTGTVFEIASSLRNPTTEFEKDLLKAAVLAEHTGGIKALIFLTDDDGFRKANSPLRRVLASYIQRAARIVVRIASLESELDTTLGPAAGLSVRQLGRFQGRVQMSDDFNEMPSDFMSNFTDTSGPLTGKA